MTFCVALKSRAGIVALADTRIVRGSERLTKGKLALVEDGDGSFFVMTSGLRSVRDKLLIYAEEALQASRAESPADADPDAASEDAPPPGPQRLYEIANVFGEQMRRVHAEDAEALAASKLSFNAHAIIGGRLPGDAEPSLFYLYPEGNWIEVADDSPWFMIGRTHYGRPILDRLMHSDASLELCLALAVLALDATAASVTDVGYPVDLLSLSATSGHLREHRYEESELDAVSRWWHERLASALPDMPMGWAAPLLDTDEPAAPLAPVAGAAAPLTASRSAARSASRAAPPTAPPAVSPGAPTPDGPSPASDSPR